MDPMWLIVLRVTERIVIYAGAIFMIYLGYSLYKRGISKGRNNLQAKIKLGQIILPGTGPGLRPSDQIAVEPQAPPPVRV